MSEITQTAIMVLGSLFLGGLIAILVTLPLFLE